MLYLLIVMKSLWRKVKVLKKFFPDSKVNLELRYREALNPLEKLQKESIFLIDNWCSGYEQKNPPIGRDWFFS
ncbi:hypothetical protein MTQ00_17040 [Chryseobacterium sp. B21-037]|uniref:hypothetical protein n=1 Tax=Chryseobacterium sp. B21-037 TaxID=2926038 RepID=UPI002359072E|nr:hypothetical protein [Chryseobacterium sp. B21-037]MDC8106229.1 hypothetical protein [Chryseobacterium sp. B21-037]